MKIRYLPLLLCLALPLAGCKTASSTTPATALAPGYFNQQDQSLGQYLAGLNAAVQTEKENYQCAPAASARQTCLTPSQQAKEKTILNSFIDATTVANAAYSAYHSGLGTFTQAQTATDKATAAQGNLVSSKAAH